MDKLDKFICCLVALVFAGVGGAELAYLDAKTVLNISVDNTGWRMVLALILFVFGAICLFMAIENKG